MNDETASDLAQYLRSHREQAGLSIRELARLTGVDVGYIHHLEAGTKRNPSAEILQRLADVLEADASELLAYIGVKPASVLPAAAVYFRRKYGLSEADAKRAADLIEERYGKEDENNQVTERE
jgi:transcriptional regulator with XRE-family HTH domain